MHVLHMQLQRTFRAQPLLTMITLELNLIMYSLCVFFQFNFLNCLELASLFRTVDDFEPFSGKIVLFQSMANHSKPNLAGKVTHVTPGNVSVVNALNMAIEKFFVPLDLGLAEGANVSLFPTLGPGLNHLHVESLVRIVPCQKLLL